MYKINIYLSLILSIKSQFDLSQFDNYQSYNTTPEVFNKINPEILQNPEYLKTLIEACNRTENVVGGDGRCSINHDCRGLRTCSIYKYC